MGVPRILYLCPEALLRHGKHEATTAKAWDTSRVRSRAAILCSLICSLTLQKAAPTHSSLLKSEGQTRGPSLTPNVLFFLSQVSVCI